MDIDELNRLLNGKHQQSSEGDKNVVENQMFASSFALSNSYYIHFAGKMYGFAKGFTGFLKMCKKKMSMK